MTGHILNENNLVKNATAHRNEGAVSYQAIYYTQRTINIFHTNQMLHSAVGKRLETCAKFNSPFITLYILINLINNLTHRALMSPAVDILCFY